MLGITTLGVDLSNPAIIAGALSGGIGFGLQNIVNNFVSGIILLIERPIKVGDWVMVGGNEGIVRRISVRSTEIQTFQRPAVIKPNAEFLSNSLINWTHKDRNGRIEFIFGVAYGTDTQQAEEILLGLAKEHEEVMTVPEPFVLFRDFGASGLDFELRCFTENVTRRLGSRAISASKSTRPSGRRISKFRSRSALCIWCRRKTVRRISKTRKSRKRRSRRRAVSPRCRTWGIAPE